MCSSFYYSTPVGLTGVLATGEIIISVTFQKRPQSCMYSKWFNNSFQFTLGMPILGFFCCWQDWEEVTLNFRIRIFQYLLAQLTQRGAWRKNMPLKSACKHNKMFTVCPGWVWKPQRKVTYSTEFSRDFWRGNQTSRKDPLWLIGEHTDGRGHCTEHTDGRWHCTEHTDGRWHCTEHTDGRGQLSIILNTLRGTLEDTVKKKSW